mmetsp:Transcript_42528/g.109327  ORF Transcript_42528/g.109327 Transcript_42528/m.109327 type:complete len:139 (-) Transcript_42528:177-593(-)
MQMLIHNSEDNSAIVDTTMNGFPTEAASSWVKEPPKRGTIRLTYRLRAEAKVNKKTREDVAKKTLPYSLTLLRLKQEEEEEKRKIAVERVTKGKYLSVTTSPPESIGSKADDASSVVSGVSNEEPSSPIRGVPVIISE